MLRKFISILLAVTAALTLCSCSLLRSDAETKNVGSAAVSGETTASGEESEKDSDGTGTEATHTTEPGPVYPVPTKRPGDPFTVCIDPGHGYVDPGSTSDYLEGKWEREVVRDYAERLKEKLEAEGCRVIMLWDENVYVTAAEVASEAKKLGIEIKEDKLVDDRRFAAYNRSVWANVLHRETYIDAFVSLHVNTYPADENVKGTRIYYCSETKWSAESSKLCTSLAGALSKVLPSQKVRYYADKAEDSFVVTKVPEMASVLVEIGFVTNPDEARNILDAEWSDSFVEGLCSGIVACKR